jgi:hypothetical protein
MATLHGDSITRARPSLKSMDYAGLLEEGVRLCTTLGGAVWTDFNEHDPGVTILEQVCYGITELGLRQDLPMADLLALPEGGGVQPHLLPCGDQILCGAALTINDYRKLLYDRVSNLKNAWLTQETAPGLFQVRVETHGEEDGSEPATREAALDKLCAEVTACLHASRNLGEDFAPVEILLPFPVRVEAEIEIAGGASASMVLAQAMFELQSYLIPFPQVHPTEQGGDQSPLKPYDDLYDGPRLELGVIDDATLCAWRGTVTVEDVARIIGKVAGVRSVDQVLLRSAEGAACASLEIPPGRVPRLEPSVFRRVPAYAIRIVRDGTPCPVSPDRVFRELAELQAGIKHRETLSAELSATDPYRRLPEGSYRQLDAYYSIQRHFPANYGIGPIGGARPGMAGAERQAQIAQLKAYLLFFEQILAGYASQIAGARRLFSLDTKLKESYFQQELVRADNPDQQPPDLPHYEVFLAQPPADAPGRYVVYLTDPARHGAIQLRSREALSVAEAERLRARMLEEGAQAANYLASPLPNGQWRLTLRGRTPEPLAFGGERFDGRASAEHEIARLALRLAALAEQPVQRDTQLRVERRERLYLRLAAEDGRTLLSADHHNQREQQRCVEAFLIYGVSADNYQVRALHGGELRLLLLGPERRLLMSGEERFATAEEAAEAAASLARLVQRVAADAGLRRRLLFRTPELPPPPSAGLRGLAAYAAGLEALERRMDAPVERRNRILDHVLARFGEAFDNEALANCDPRRFGERDAFYGELLQWKLAFLKDIVNLSGRRSVARDYSREGSRSQLERRLFCLLGMMGTATELDAAPAGAAVQPPVIYRRVHRHQPGPAGAGRHWVFRSDNPNLLQILLKHGIERERYTAVAAHGRAEVRFQWPGQDGHGVPVFHARNAEEAQGAIAGITSHLARLALHPERIYAGEDVLLVEHILLQAADPDQQLRLSLFFPDWPLRFQNPDFRRLAERTVADNCPAHLAASCHWLSAGEMVELRRLEQAWRVLQQQAAGREAPPALRHAAGQLHDFIGRMEGKG